MPWPRLGCSSPTWPNRRRPRGSWPGRPSTTTQPPFPASWPCERRNWPHNEGAMAEFVIVTGMSGAGRSQAGATLEDLGWFVVDNLPTPLILDFAALATSPGSGRDRVVLVVGRDIEQLDELVPAVDELRRRGITV